MLIQNIALYEDKYFIRVNQENAQKRIIFEKKKKI